MYIYMNEVSFEGYYNTILYAFYKYNEKNKKNLLLVGVISSYVNY